MARLDLRIRNLETAETLLAAFESELDALTWLKDRPPFIEVLGVATHGLPRELYATLKNLSRPLDAEEQARVAALDAAEAAATVVLAEAERTRAADEAEAHREAMRTADPNRLMNITWTRDGDLRLTDPADPRTITDLAREAVLAWVCERESWVADRGQVVAEATVDVWPGPLPRANADRVRAGGTFVAEPAPAKPAT